MWAVIAVAVLYHEIACKNGELLSEAADRGRDKHPFLVNGLIAVTAAHLLRRLPRHVDPYTRFGEMYLRMKGTTR